MQPILPSIFNIQDRFTNVGDTLHFSLHVGWCTFLKKRCPTGATTGPLFGAEEAGHFLPESTLDFRKHTKWPHMSKANKFCIDWRSRCQNRLINMGYTTSQVNLKKNCSIGMLVCFVPLLCPYIGIFDFLEVQGVV